MNTTFSVAAPEEFQAVVAYILAHTADRPTVCVALFGDLGAGKTTFTQQLAKHLGVTEPVTSPTFTIMKQYALNHDRFDRLVHIDAYRLEDASEAAPLRIAEVMCAPRTITCLEWPERIPDVVPPDAVRVDIVITEGEVRKVRVSLL